MYNMFIHCNKFLFTQQSQAHNLLQSYLLEQNAVFCACWLQLSVHKAQRFNFFLPFFTWGQYAPPACGHSLRTQAHFNIKSWKKKPQHWHISTMWFSTLFFMLCSTKIISLGKQGKTCIFDCEFRRTLFPQEWVGATSDDVDFAQSGFRPYLWVK